MIVMSPIWKITENLNNLLEPIWIENLKKKEQNSQGMKEDTDTFLELYQSSAWSNISFHILDVFK